MLHKFMGIGMIFVLMLTGCVFPAAAAQGGEAAAGVAAPVDTATVTATIETPVASSTATVTTLPKTPTTTATHAPIAYGPNNFPSGINPLTGQPVLDPKNLLNPPALISVTNFPPSARPQAGLSYSPFVFELYIGALLRRLPGSGDQSPGGRSEHAADFHWPGAFGAPALREPAQAL
jgi:hypothetical protein